MGGGWGGRPHEDGENATVSMCQGDVQNAPVEMQEIYYPVLVERQQLRDGSGGAGKFRGGLGIEVSVRVLCDASTPISTSNANARRRGACLAANAAKRSRRSSDNHRRSGVVADEEAQLSIEDGRQRDVLYRRRRLTVREERRVS